MWSAVRYQLSKLVRRRRKPEPTNSKIQSYMTAINFSPLDGTARFPKLEECSHFHYGLVSFRQLQLNLCENDKCLHNENDVREHVYWVEVMSGKKKWTVHRTYNDFCDLDRQLHECVYDRKFSHLPMLSPDEEKYKSEQEMMKFLSHYLKKFSNVATCLINCATVLKWLEMDNLGNRLLTVDDCGINTPAVAVAHVVKRYTAQTADEITIEVGDIISVIDKLPSDVTAWWRGKKNFEVGFFPSECVEVIGNTVPPFVASRILQPSALKRQNLKRRKLKILRKKFNSKTKVFGVDLTIHLQNTGRDVPEILECCTEVIERNGVVDGMYWKPGIKSNIVKLRQAFDEGHVPDMMSENFGANVHNISALLKLYFYELPNVLLTYQLYDKFVDAVRDVDNQLNKIHNALQQLPLPHLKTTEYLIRHLSQMADHELQTNVKLKNLAVIWAPVIIRSRDTVIGEMPTVFQASVVECLISHCSVIFSGKMSLYSVSDLQNSQKKPDIKLLNNSKSRHLISLEQARRKNGIIKPILDPRQKYIDVPVYPCHSGYRQMHSKTDSAKGRSILDHGFADINSLNRNNNFSLNCGTESEKVEVWLPSARHYSIRIMIGLSGKSQNVWVLICLIFPPLQTPLNWVHGSVRCIQNNSNHNIYGNLRVWY